MLTADDKSLLLSSAEFFFKINFKNLSGTLSVLIGLDPDQDQQNVGPDLVQTICKGCMSRSRGGGGGRGYGPHRKITKI